MNIVLSIHPKWAKLIYSGKKTIEIRKSFPNDFKPETEKVFLYETAPVNKVTGYVYLKDIPEVLSSKLLMFSADVNGAERRSCVPAREIVNYAKKGNGRIFFWDIRTSVKFDNPFVLREKRAPQSWQYANVGYMEEVK